MKEASCKGLSPAMAALSSTFHSLLLLDIAVLQPRRGRNRSGLGSSPFARSLFSDLSMRKPDACLGVTGHDHSQVAASIMLAFERELDGHPAQVVLVVDDMTATMSCSIVAKKRGLKVAHVIAGTRSFDMNMPREVNRTIVDAISDYLFTAGMVANRNLNQEGMIPDYIHYVGNILIDTIRFNRHRLVQPMWFSSLGLRKGNYLLLTLNRRDLLEKKAVLHSLLQTVIEKADENGIIFREEG